jgi:transposase
MAIVDRRGLPLAVHVARASPNEVRLIDATLAARFLTAYPARLIGDRAYDSDPLDARLQQQYGIALIARHKVNRIRPVTQDGRVLRRVKRRWVVERFFAWLHNSRRLVARWERHVENFLGMLQLACMRILLNRL